MAEPSGRVRRLATRFRHVWRPKLAAASVVLGFSLGLQGCDQTSDIATHIYPNWRQEPDYLVDFQFTLPGEYNPFLNSCSMRGLAGGMQCSGRGKCTAWDETTSDSITFCKCDTDWADPECRTKRKSQFIAYFCSLFGGVFGLDHFYVGDVGGGIAKAVTVGGFGIWYAVDIVRFGSGNPYATVYRHSPISETTVATSHRLATDLPHWCYFTSIMVWFYAMGFTFAFLAARRSIFTKRRDYLLLQVMEQRFPGLTAYSHDAWVATHFPESTKRTRTLQNPDMVGPAYGAAGSAPPMGMMAAPGNYYAQGPPAKQVAF